MPDLTAQLQKTDIDAADDLHVRCAFCCQLPWCWQLSQDRHAGLNWLVAALHLPDLWHLCWLPRHTLRAKQSDVIGAWGDTW